MSDLAINLLASIIAGVAVWLYQRTAQFQRVNRRKLFFGITKDAECIVSVPRHASSPRPNSVHRRDLAAVVEVAVIVEECSGEVDININSDGERDIGTATEFCIGGPLANNRTAAHLERFVPGFYMAPWPEDRSLTMRLGTVKFHRAEHHEEYAFVIRIALPAPAVGPLWIICGQVAVTNQAAARYIRLNYKELRKQYGNKRSFCIALRVLDSHAYGHSQVQVAGDYTHLAFTEISPNFD